MPTASAEHDYGDFSYPKILLIRDSLVSRHEYFETGCLSGVEQVAVFQFVPSKCFAFAYAVAGKR